MTELKGPANLFLVPLPLIGADGAGARYKFVATADQRLSLSTRFGCTEIPKFEVEVLIAPLRKEGHYLVQGTVSAKVIQSCVVSLAPVYSDIEQEFSLLLLSDGKEDDEDLRVDDEDFEIYSGNSVDIGEIGAVELALALDPYPRAEGVSVSDLGPGGLDMGYDVSEEGQTARNRPFEALAALKRKG